MVQSASYGTEMLCSSISRCHSIGLAIRDGIVWVWWYDRQGAIQSHGIDIIRNLRHFLVLLLTFQRFNLEQWGFNTKLNPGVERIHRDATETEKIYQQYSLAGKSTRVLGAASRSPHPRSSSSLANTKLVAKSYWPNVLRLSEGIIITHAVEKAGSTDHLPDLICSSDGYLTKSIRDELGLESPKGTCRVFRIAIFERLDPITKLEGEAFLKAWLECIKCHYTLWNGGIQHRDLSLSNLMLRTKGDQLFGVVNDWDLSFVEEHSPVLREHAATIPFLSIDLLRKEYWDGDINVLYRHDLESFVWVLVWVLHCYDRGSICIPPSLMQWQTADYGLCTTFKVKFLSQYHKYRQYTVRTGWTTEAPIVRRLISWLNGIQNQEPVVDEPEVDEPEAMLTEFTGQLREASKAGGLEYMSQLISDCLVDGSK
ncbi:hypothetical protein BDV93DRAFT_120594 [Ceratobasidium sp. AG-I]|nr:hypothetical protein BDV93DRAFT_120594 [Ceratobasidium sp. AG-I]